MIRGDEKGNPAFPVPAYVNSQGETWDVHMQGMTLRQYYAAAAMQGIMASEEINFSIMCPDSREVAKMAFRIADRMLEVENE